MNSLYAKPVEMTGRGVTRRGHGQHIAIRSKNVEDVGRRYGRRCGRRENPRVKRGRRWLISKKRNVLFLHIPRTSSTFGSGILTSSTTSSTASSNVFQASHGNQVNPKASHERCQKKARALSLSLSLSLSLGSAVLFAEAERSEASEASEHHLVRQCLHT